MIYGKKFEGETVDLSGEQYWYCHFVDCNVRGMPDQILNCVFLRCDGAVIGSFCVSWECTNTRFHERPNVSEMADCKAFADPRYRVGQDPVGCTCPPEAHFMNERCGVCREVAANMRKSSSPFVG